MHVAVFVGLVGVLVALFFWAIAYFRVHKKPSNCVVCGLPSRFGYSMQAESARKDIASVCLNCLKKKLAEDYEKFEARALVIEPAPDLPCYVFQPSRNWKDYKPVRGDGNAALNYEISLSSLRSESQLSLGDLKWIARRQCGNAIRSRNCRNLASVGEQLPFLLLRWLLCRPYMSKYRKPAFDVC
jgi:hypothetical protein